MSLQVLDGASEVATAAAGQFVALAERAIVEGGRFRVALSGGSTPRALYALLAAEPHRDRVDWSRVEIFFGDERCVPPDHPESNARMATETLLGKVPIDPAQVHRILGEREPAEAALAYAATLEKVLPGRPPRLDLVLLGMGADGHTASLFPGTSALFEQQASTAVVYVERLRSHRVTLTLPVLSAARAAMVLVVGADKAATLAAALAGPPDLLPIQRVHPRGEMIWLVDRAAASKMPAGSW